MTRTIGRRLASVAFLAATLPAPALATTLYTAAIPVAGGRQVECTLANLSDTAFAEAEVRLLDRRGATVASRSFSIDPGAAATLPTTLAFSQRYRCVFDVRTNAKKVRGAICVLEGSDCMTVLPAQ